MTYMGMDISSKGHKRSRAASYSAARSAERRQCPECGRLGALGSRIEVDDAWTVRVCRYCGHGVGRLDGVSFGTAAASRVKGEDDA